MTSLLSASVVPRASVVPEEVPNGPEHIDVADDADDLTWRASRVPHRSLTRAALRILLKGSARIHGLTTPDGRPVHSLRNSINHYSNTYGGTDGGSKARALRSPLEALRAYIARMFPRLTSAEEARSIVVDVTAQYEALARSTSGRESPVRRGTRPAA
jgi:hypothetical protein